MKKDLKDILTRLKYSKKDRQVYQSVACFDNLLLAFDKVTIYLIGDLEELRTTPAKHYDKRSVLKADYDLNFVEPVYVFSIVTHEGIANCIDKYPLTQAFNFSDGVIDGNIYTLEGVTFYMKDIDNVRKFLAGANGEMLRSEAKKSQMLRFNKGNRTIFICPVILEPCNND